MPLGYLTPDTVPTDTDCRAIFFPRSEQWIAVITGALNALVLPESWEKYGFITPEEAASAFAPFFDQFCFKQGECRVIGEIICYAGSASPYSNWLPCDGASLLRSAYPDLFAVIGTIYGAADGSHFNVPDLRGRAAIGSGSGMGLTNRALGSAVGAETHSLTASENGPHQHAISPLLSSLAQTPVTPIPVWAPLAGIGYTQFDGNGTAHNNMQPSLAISYFIVS